MKHDVSSFDAALAQLQADPRFKALTRREQNFIVMFLSSVTGDRFADGANFHSDLRSYGYKNIDHLLRVFNTHYPNFARVAPISEDWLVRLLRPEGEVTGMVAWGVEQGLSKARQRIARLVKSTIRKEEGKPLKIPLEGTAALLGELETLLEEILEKLGWRPAVHVSWVDEGLQAILEDWVEHDPAVGVYGGTEGRVVFDLVNDETLSMKFRWESHVSPERRNSVQDAFEKNESRIIDALTSIMMGR